MSILESLPVNFYDVDSHQENETSQNDDSRVCIVGVIAPNTLRNELQKSLASFDLHLCATIEEALVDMLNANHIPDVILLCLPDEQARFFSQLLHEDHHLALTPIILIYDQSESHEPGKVLSLGATDLIRAPIEDDELISLIHKHEQTRQTWWKTFHIHSPERPKQLLSRLKTWNRLAEQQGTQNPFQGFKDFLFQKSQLLPDRVKYLQPYNSDQLFQLGDALYLDSNQLSEAIAEYFRYSLLENLDQYTILSDILPSAFCRRNLVLPISDAHGDYFVALANPFQLEVMDILQRRLKPLRILIAPPELLEEVLDPAFKQSHRYTQWKQQQHVRFGRPLKKMIFHHEPEHHEAEHFLSGPLLNSNLDPYLALERAPLPENRSQQAPPAIRISEDDASDISLSVPDETMASVRPINEDIGEPVDELDLVNSDEEPLPFLDSIESEQFLEPLSAQETAESDALRTMDVQKMEQRLMRAYHAYQEKKSSRENTSQSSSLIVDSDPEVAPIIHLVNSLIEKAYRMGASDIHIEPWAEHVLVRYRIDGQLQIMHRLQPQAIIKPLITRIKIMSQLDISERRLPQDGNIPFQEFNPDYDLNLRVSVVPLNHGEKAVLRLLDSHRGPMPLEQVGFSASALASYRRLIHSPYGMILHVGPTGSGKTSTLYSALKEINQPDRNISTIEEPIEYFLPGINQLQVRHEIGMDFVRALRAYLRQDPDILLVGEIRDEETVHVAIEAALTGHLLFSTLHTNDAASTLVRLLEMGIKPYMISSALLGICAQRLLRKLCAYCRQVYTPKPVVLQWLGLHPDKPIQFYNAIGCEHCQNGYHGRIGVFEILVLNDHLRAVMNQPHVTAEILQEAAVRQGMRTLFQEAVAKAMLGIISIEELALKILHHEPGQVDFDPTKV